MNILAKRLKKITFFTKNLLKRLNNFTFFSRFKTKTRQNLKICGHIGPFPCDRRGVSYKTTPFVIRILIAAKIGDPFLSDLFRGSLVSVDLIVHFPHVVG